MIIIDNEMLWRQFRVAIDAFGDARMNYRKRIYGLTSQISGWRLGSRRSGIWATTRCFG